MSGGIKKVGTSGRFVAIKEAGADFWTIFDEGQPAIMEHVVRRGISDDELPGWTEEMCLAVVGKNH